MVDPNKIARIDRYLSIRAADAFPPQNRTTIAPILPRCEKNRNPQSEIEPQLHPPAVDLFLFARKRQHYKGEDAAPKMESKNGEDDEGEERLVAAMTGNPRSCRDGDESLGKSAIGGGGHV